MPKFSRTSVFWPGDGIRRSWKIEANNAVEWHRRLGSALSAYGYFWLRWMGVR